MPGGRDREEMPRARGLAQDLTTAADRLTIVLDGTRVIITTDDGRSVKLQTDGKEEERLTGDGVIKSKTRWNSEQLVSEDKIQDGPKVTRTYTVSSDLRQLIVTQKIDGGGMFGQVLVHHVFDRKEGPPGGP
jgi:hypothetical protein